MDTTRIVELYEKDFKSLRSIAEEFNTNHHKIKRILLKNGTVLNNKNRVRKPISEERRKQIKNHFKEYYKTNTPHNKGKQVLKVTLYKNMRAHLKYDISLEWLMKFEDIEKLKFLNKSISRKRDSEGFTDKLYISFIEFFYNDKQFNTIYNTWLENKKDRYLKPSLDHIVPKSKEGSLFLKNLQFLTWLENRCKNNLSQKEWNKVKNNIEKYLWITK